ncbi:MAG: SsrA-binding protein [Clostridia bacterium]|nr:MAG: SsrA-binding protein [Clostridia bacterium]
MNIKIIATNRKARHEYEIIETAEAGIALTGTEIKSIRERQVSLKEGFATIKGGEVWLMDVHIAPYKHGHRDNHDPRRPRKLLLHRNEINRLEGKLTEKGWTLIPLKMYLKNNRAKVEIGLARGKKKYDKRKAIAERDAQRDIERAMKHY